MRKTLSLATLSVGIFGFTLISAPQISLSALPNTPQSAQQKQIASTENPFESHKVFLELMAAPDDPALNLKYAKINMKKGAFNRALEAFRRVLSVDPLNTEAKNGIAIILNAQKQDGAKAKTDYTITLGLQYENNAPHRDPSFLRFDDSTAKLGLGVRDRRQLFNQSFETSAVLFKSLHNRYRPGDLLYIGLDSGPVLQLDKATLRVAPTFKYARINTRDLFFSYGISTRYRRDTSALFKGADINASYDDYKNEAVAFTGPRFSIKLKYLLNGVFNGDDSLRIDPIYEHVHGVGGDGANRYDSLGINFKYRRPADKAVLFTGQLTAAARLYGGKDAAELSFANRRDLKIKPEARLTFQDLLPYKGILDTHINYEINISNDQDKKFRGYQIGGTTKWKF